MVGFEEIVDKIENKTEDTIAGSGERTQEEQSKNETRAKPDPPKKKINPYGVIAIVTVIAVLAIIVATVLFVNVHNRNKNLKAELKAAEEEVERQKQLALELEAHTVGQKSRLEKLEEQVEELLNIEEPEPVITSSQIKEQLSAISDLVTQEYLYTNADKGDYNKTWLWDWDMPFSDKSFIAKYDGTIKAGIDLTAVEIDVNEDSRTITVTLPASRITDNNVPQDKIEVFGIKDGLFNKVTPDDTNALIAEGKENMEAKAIERGLLAGADKQAQSLIRAFLALIPGMDSYELNVQ